MSEEIDGEIETIEKESEKSPKPRGGARPGAGRPKGGKNAATLELEALAKECAPAAMATLKIIALKGKSESARVAACQAILDRGYGKPRQALEHSGEGGGPLNVFVTHEIVDASASG